jgi:hypothetical protein
MLGDEEMPTLETELNEWEEIIHAAKTTKVR